MIPLATCLWRCSVDTDQDHNISDCPVMKQKLLSVLIAASVVLSALCGLAEDTNGVTTELGVLIMSVNNKLKQGKDTEAALAPELKQFDALYEKYKNDKSDDVAQILFMKAMLYMQVLDDPDESVALIKEIQKEFPTSKQAKASEQVLASIQHQAASRKIRVALVEGSPFPDFNEKDLAGQPLSVSEYKGKVLLIDFWATWCGPCVNELPNVIKTYQAHHAQGFDIIGVSLDQDESKLKSFIKERNMAWRQFFDGKGWENKLATKYGITSIPATFLLDRDGKIIGKDLRGESLEEAVTKALAQK